MAKVKPYVYTDLSAADTLLLKIEGIGQYTIAQYSDSFALNDVPRASCLVATGRDARNVDQLAEIHRTGAKLKQMFRAKVLFHPRGEWDNKGTLWTGPEVIFDGYYVGMAYRKVSGKVQPVIHLIHWLVDLSASSTLSANQHPSNPTSLVHPAVVPMTQDSGAGKPPCYVSHLVGHEDIRAKCNIDLWEGIKTMLCELAEIDKFEVTCGQGLGTGNKRKNDRALTALKRIQGPSPKCDLPYNAKMGGFPLPLHDNGVPLVRNAVADAVTQQTIESFAGTTFWDVMIGCYFPMFSMALVPQVSVATVIADTPGLGGADDDDHRWKKIIKPEEYDSHDLSAMISRPLQGVGVYGDYESLTKIEMTESNRFVCIGGHFASDSVGDADGAWLVVESPPWLKAIPTSGLYAGETSGAVNGNPSNTATTPGNNNKPKDPTPGKTLVQVSTLYDRYAQCVYMANMLRGRGASISGKMRFDIAPGSIVRLEPKPEIFSEGIDSLAVPLYAHVVQVSTSINAEGQRAGTTYQLTHIRTEHEFLDEPRTFIPAHPLFGPKVYVGAPLVENWEFPDV